MSEMKSLTLNDKKYDGFVDPVARAWAAASAVINPASGESITVTDASDGKPYGLTIYGKTTQNGTPTPDAPVDLVSVGDSGSITVNVTGENDARGMTIETPNGLPGIPVTSGGNYTDTSGQQWICDEIDLANGVYVQRVNRITLDGSENWGKSSDAATSYAYYVKMPDALIEQPLCNRLEAKVGDNPYIATGKTGGGATALIVSLGYMETNTAESFKMVLSQTPLDVQYVLAEPIEKPLPEEEIAAYSALHTYKDLTTVSNDAGAWMELEYVMDTKKYIDSMISGAIIPATVE